MKKELLRMNELEKYEVIKECIKTKGPKTRYALKLGITVRHLNRLIHKIKDKGKKGFIHGNRGREPKNKSDAVFVENIISKIKEKYLESNKSCLIGNINHIKDLLFEYDNINVSYATLYRILMKNKIQSPKIQRKTKRRLKKEELLATKAKKIDTLKVDKIVDNIIQIEDAHPTKEKKQNFGEEIQMDACSKTWNNAFFAHLHLAIDNCTGMIVGGFFDNQETIKGYYNVFKQILTNYGIPMCFKTDKRTVFTFESSKQKNDENNTMIQFAYCCKTLGCELQCSSIPQFKAMIERANGTFQDRLNTELRIHNITSLKDANDYLINIFIPKFNDKFALDPKLYNSVFVPIDKQMIDYHLSILSRRVVLKGCIISYKNNKYYMLNDYDERILFSPGTKCLVIETLNNELFCNIDNQTYHLRLFTGNEKYIYGNQRTPFEKREKKHSKPPITHPWRLSNYDSFQEVYNPHKKEPY